MSTPTTTPTPTTDLRRDLLSDRADNLHVAADQQIGELIDILSTADASTLHRPCPGREKLGDGTIGAIAAHTTENYERIGSFLTTRDRTVTRHGNDQTGRHRLPGFLRALGHTPPDDTQHGGHDDGYKADSATPSEIVERLEAASERLASIAGLTDQQLDAVPPKDSFRFCDGQRTLEQVLAGLLKHQDRQVQTIKAALSATT
jgi:hypothetical protein